MSPQKAPQEVSLEVNAFSYIMGRFVARGSYEGETINVVLIGESCVDAIVSTFGDMDAFLMMAGGDNGYPTLFGTINETTQPTRMLPFKVLRKGTFKIHVHDAVLEDKYYFRDTVFNCTLNLLDDNKASPQSASSLEAK